MTAVDRMSKGYVPDFDIDSEIGAQGQLFVGRILDALAASRHEVKTDEKAQETGNIYLEVQCLTRGGWTRSASGVFTTSDIWCHVIGEAVIIGTVPHVRGIAQHYWGSRYQKECMRGSHPTKGVVLPIPMFVRDLAFGLPGTKQGELSA